MPGRTALGVILILAGAGVGFVGTATASEDLGAAIADVFAPLTAAGSPGCAVAVVRHGELVHAGGYGLANLDHRVPISPDTPFHASSLAKPFTATAVLLLVQRGALSLDDDVRRYLPELPDYGTTITLLNLLEHTSGLRDQWDLLVLNGWRHTRDLITDADVMHVVTKQQALNFPPGTRHLYSNTNYTLLARIVARVSGQSFRAFTDEHVFAPLSMQRTFFRDNFGEVVPGLAYGYSPAADGFELHVTNFDTVGPTSLITTVTDLAQWERNFIDPLVLDAALLARMTRRGRLNGTAFDYGLGWMRATHRGEEVVEHEGADAGYRAHFMRFPRRALAIACLCNLPVSAASLAREVADLFLDAPPAPELPGRGAAPTDAPSAEQRLALTGLYRDAPGDQFLEIFERQQTLHVRITGSEWQLEPLEADAYRLLDSDVELTVHRDPRRPDRITSLTMPGRARFERVDRAELDAAAWRSLAGTYDSEELDIPYVIMRTESGASIRWLKQHPVSLRPAVDDVFFADRLLIRMERDRRGRISGFTLSTGRVRGLKFQRR